MSGILAIDQAITSGYAAAAPGQPPEWGHKRMGGPGDSEGYLFASFRAWVVELIVRYEPIDLAWEASFVPRPDRSKAAAPFNLDQIKLAMGWRAHLLALAEEFDLRVPREYQTSDVTKFLTGRGAYPGASYEQRRVARNAAMVMACQARGYEVATHDEANALGILLCAEYELYPREALTRPRTLKAPTGPLFSVRA